MANLTYKHFALDTASLSEKGRDYLLQYGFAKSLQDSVGGMRKELATPDESGKVMSESEIEAELNAAMQERFDDILKGEVGTRTQGPRLRGIDKVKFDIAVEELKAAFGTKKLAWPTGKGSAEIIGKYVAAFLAKHDDRVTKEANRRMKTQANVEFDLADLGL